MTGCLRLPASLEDADAIIASCVGSADWRPLFLTGLVAAAIFVLALTVLIQAIKSVVR